MLQLLLPPVCLRLGILAMVQSIGKGQPKEFSICDHSFGGLFPPHSISWPPEKIGHAGNLYYNGGNSLALRGG